MGSVLIHQSMRQYYHPWLVCPYHSACIVYKYHWSSTHRVFRMVVSLTGSKRVYRGSWYLVLRRIRYRFDRFGIQLHNRPWSQSFDLIGYARWAPISKSMRQTRIQRSEIVCTDDVASCPRWHYGVNLPILPDLHICPIHEIRIDWTLSF